MPTATVCGYIRVTRWRLSPITTIGSIVRRPRTHRRTIIQTAAKGCGKDVGVSLILVLLNGVVWA